MTNPSTLLITVFALLALANSANAWGSEGHEAVASIAYANLTPRAKAGVDALIKSSPDVKSIEDASTWPDRHKSPKTAPQHYIQYPDSPGDCGRTAALPTSCEDTGCVVTAIAASAKILSANKSGKEAGQALAYLVHYVGDIAQPLHASGYERGSNNIKVKFAKKTVNLHSLWDSTLIRQVQSDDFGGSAEQWVDALLTKPAPADTMAECAASVDPTNEAKVTACAESWAKNSEALVCSAVYRDGLQAGDQTNGAYYKANKDIVNAQVLKGGLRLAAILTKIFGGI
ncbi:hypothetical protein H9P43_001034 [Blastocladiella emersonii ATCC 22665]|nr:hypothetical protein H9P43_001034 [Blastocladiella emersonii ATCC 22665]